MIKAIRANQIAGIPIRKGNFFPSLTALLRNLGVAYSAMARERTVERTSPGLAPRGQRVLQSPHSWQSQMSPLARSYA